MFVDDTESKIHFMTYEHAIDGDHSDLSDVTVIFVPTKEIEKSEVERYAEVLLKRNCHDFAFCDDEQTGWELIFDFVCADYYCDSEDVATTWEIKSIETLKDEVWAALKEYVWVVCRDFDTIRGCVDALNGEIDLSHIIAHRSSSNHKKALEHDKICGCFYCLKIFSPKEIKMWIQGEPGDALGTAICPYCGIDSVIGESSGFPITHEFLRRMEKYWFNCLPEDVT